MNMDAMIGNLARERKEGVTVQTKLAELVAELQSANKALDDAKRAESIARSVACDASNTVSRIQKAIDKEIAALKEKAEWNTEWHSQRRLRDVVPVQ